MNAADLKPIVRRFFRNFGLDISRHKKYGNNALDDVTAIRGTAGVRTVIDVGANEGDMALNCAGQFPDAAVFSFEPFPEAYRKLQQRVRPNRRIQPIMAAVGASPGMQRMFVTKSSCTSSLLPTAKQAATYLGDWVDDAGTIEVPVTTIDAFSKDRGLEFIDLLKIDTQGYELHVLQGAEESLATGRIKVILVEVNFVPLYENQAYFHDVYARLWSKHYRLVNLYNEDFRSAPFIHWCDALFVHTAE